MFLLSDVIIIQNVSHVFQSGVVLSEVAHTIITNFFVEPDTQLSSSRPLLCNSLLSRIINCCTDYKRNPVPGDKGYFE